MAALDALPPEVAGRIVPGMPAEVLIVTGERSLLTYPIAPVRDALARAMRDEEAHTCEKRSSVRRRTHSKTS